MRLTSAFRRACRRNFDNRRVHSNLGSRPVAAQTADFDAAVAAIARRLAGDLFEATGHTMDESRSFGLRVGPR